MSDDAVFKGAGSFRVDRQRALQKLALFSMARDEDFILALVRAAVAGGAKKLHLLKGGGLELRFSGEPFTADELKDPYAALFSDGTTPRLRHLAVGLLTCLRTNPKLIVIESGRTGARRRLEVRSLHGEVLSEISTKGGDTIIAVRWPFGAGWTRYRAAVKRARAALAFVPEGFLIEGEQALPPPKPGPAWHLFTSGPLRGRVTLPTLGAPGSTVTFCVDGVAVQTVETWLPWAQVQAWVDDPSLTLNASQSAVVEDDRRRAVLDAVAEASRDFLSATARTLSAKRPEGALAGQDWGQFTELIPWLREACIRLLKSPETTKEPLLGELRQAPVLLDVCYGALSLGALEAEKKAAGTVSWSQKPCPGLHPPGRVAWADDKATREFLKSHFHDLRDLTGLVESLTRVP